MPGAGGGVYREDGWKMLHLLAYLAEMAAQNSMLPSVVVCGLWFLGRRGSRGGIRELML